MKLIITLALLLFFVCNSFAAPLVYKSEKQAKSGEFVDLGSFDASKYKQLRIVVFTGGINKSTLIVTGGEADDNGGIFTADFETTFSTILEVPPSKVGVKVRGEGNCRVYVYGTE